MTAWDAQEYLAKLSLRDYATLAKEALEWDVDFGGSSWTSETPVKYSRITGDGLIICEQIINKDDADYIVYAVKTLPKLANMVTTLLKALEIAGVKT